MSALPFAPPLGALTLAAALASLSLPATAQIQPLCLPINHMGTIDDAEAHHVLNRMTFGPTTSLLATLQGTNGWSTLLQQQLTPASLAENPDLVTIRDQLKLPMAGIPWTTGPLVTLKEMQAARIAHAMLSKRQLQEVMTEFWEHHFNTNIGQLATWIAQNLTGPSGGLTQQELQHAQCWMEWTQYDGFRTDALGTFEDLLRGLILSPSMMVYLNMVDSKCSATQKPNENFARELLELYTMGPVHLPFGRPNYDQDDIVAVAEILSGWQLVPGTFPLVTPQPNGPHCGNAQALFPNGAVPIPAGTAQQQLDALVDALAGYPPVRDRMCRKLAAYFLTDAAYELGVEDALIQAMKTAWGPDGDIRATLCVLFNSTAFQGSTYRWLRVRSPLERVVWNARIWDSQPTSQGAVSFASLTKPYEDVLDMGMGLFTYPTPKGFPLVSVERLGSSTMLEGVIAGADIYRAVKPAFDQGPASYPLAWLLSPTPAMLPIVQIALPNQVDQANPQLVAQVILDRLYPGIWTAADQAQVVTALGTTLDPVNTPAYVVDLARGIAIAFSFHYATLQ